MRQKAADALAVASAEWTTISEKVPQMVAAIQSRVDILSKSSKLPKNLDKVSFDAAKTGLESIKNYWTDASAEFTAGNVSIAAERGRAAMTKGEEVLKLLGMSS